MGGFSALTGDPDLLTTLIPEDPRDLQRKIRCNDEFVGNMSSRDGLNPQTIKLLIPVWKICSSFRDLQEEITRCLENIWMVSEPYSGYINPRSRGIVDFFQSIGIRRRAAIESRARFRVEIAHLRFRLMSRLRHLVYKIDKLHEKAVMDYRLTLDHPELYSESPLFNGEIAYASDRVNAEYSDSISPKIIDLPTLQVSRVDYHHFLLHVRNDIATYWNELKTYADANLGGKNPRMARPWSWKKTVFGFVLGITMGIFLSTMLHRHLDSPKQYTCLTIP